MSLLMAGELDQMVFKDPFKFRWFYDSIIMSKQRLFAYFMQLGLPYREDKAVSSTVFYLEARGK